MYCKNCNVNVDTDRDVCPLCGGKLEGEKGVSTYPQKKVRKKNLPITVTSLYMAITIPELIICTALNVVFESEYLWALFALIMALYGYYTLKTTIFYKGPDGAKIFSQTFMLSMICIAVQYIFKTSEWAFAYAIPSLILIAMALHIVFIGVFKNKGGKRFFRYMWLTNLLGLLPMIMVFAGISKNPMLPTITFIICGFSLMLQVLIMGHDIFDEIKKKSHI